MTKKRPKIAIITTSLGGGGAQKSSANLSFVLSKLDYEVHLISILNKIDYDYEGHLLNLGLLKDNSDTFVDKIKRFWGLYKYLKNHDFDFIIDSRSRPTFWKQWVINSLLYSNQKVIFVVHNYFLKTYFPSNRFLAKILYKRSDSFVAVSEEIRALVMKQYGFRNISTIYNAVPKLAFNKSFLPNEFPKQYVLYFGRIDDKVKNISLLLEVYQKSDLPQNNIHLVILGDGPDVLKLKTKVQQMKLSDFIFFTPYVTHPNAIISNAFFTTLTSTHEGFPMVLIESLALGVPVVSVDCKSGPKEIIQHKINGLLVKNHNIKALAEAYNLMMEDKLLYKKCKENAQQSVDKFSVEQVASSWKDILTNNR